MTRRNLSISNFDGTSCFLNAVIIALFFPKEIRHVVKTKILTPTTKYGISDIQWLSIIYQYVSKYPIFSDIRRNLLPLSCQTEDILELSQHCMIYLRYRHEIKELVAENNYEDASVLIGNIHFMIDNFKQRLCIEANIPCKHLLNETYTYFNQLKEINNASNDTEYLELTWLFELTDILRCVPYEINMETRECISEIIDSFDNMSFTSEMTKLWRQRLFNHHDVLLTGQQGLTDALVALFSRCGSDGLFQEEHLEVKRSQGLSDRYHDIISKHNILRLDNLPYLIHEIKTCIFHDITYDLHHCSGILDISMMQSKDSFLLPNQDLLIFSISDSPINFNKTIFYGVWVRNSCMLNVCVYDHYYSESATMFSKSKTIYILQSVICFKGNRNSGHFVVWVLYDNHWYFNDCMHGEFILRHPSERKEWDPRNHGVLFIYKLVEL